MLLLALRQGTKRTRNTQNRAIPPKITSGNRNLSVFDYSEPDEHLSLAE